MAYTAVYNDVVPDRAEIDALTGSTLIEFSTGWCPHCLRAQVLIEAALRAHPDIHHIKLEDGPGRRLGRSFRVKLWPTLILMREGHESGRIVRPASVQELSDLLLSA